MKTVLFVPGFRDSATADEYDRLRVVIREQGYSVRLVPIRWSRTTIRHWVPELVQVLDEYDPAKTILAGYSYGAMTAFVTAAQRNPHQLWLCSLSPYFAEDLSHLDPAWLKSIGVRRVKSFEQLPFEPLASTITCDTLIMVGQDEAGQSFIRAQEAARLIPRSRLVVAPNSGHDATTKDYLRALGKAISRLRAS
jgi:pimeloyl-ACP methyl ester carboxylesterase